MSAPADAHSLTQVAQHLLRLSVPFDPRQDGAPDDGGPDLKGYLHTLHDNRWLIGGITAAITLVALLYAHARTVRKTSFVVMTGFALTARRLLQGYAVPSVVYSGLQAFAKTSPPEKVPRKPPPLKGGRGISGLGFPENRENGEFRGVRLAISTPHCSPAHHAPPAP